jgi:hypothetical protein
MKTILNLKNRPIIPKPIGEPINENKQHTKNEK